MNPILLLALSFCFLFTACAHGNRSDTRSAPQAARSTDDDPYLWLEEIESSQSLDWVRAHNAKSLAVFEKDPRFKSIEKEARRVLLSNERIPYPKYRNGYAYNFWQDAKHVRGIWRRASLAEYAKPAPKWDVLIDLDALASQEKDNWVWKGVDCLPPAHERCLVRLSRGGKDAITLREFDIKSRKFVTPAEGGFFLPEAKLVFAWVDNDALVVGTDFGFDSQTRAGYPRLLKYWKRGQPLEKAKRIFDVSSDDVESNVESEFLPAPAGSKDPVESIVFLLRRKTFFTQDYWVFDPQSGSKTKVPIPEDAHISELFHDLLLVQLRKPWGEFPSGALVALQYKRSSSDPGEITFGPPELVFAPGERSAITGVAATKSTLLVNVLDNVKGSISTLTKENGRWTMSKLKLGENGTVGLVSTDPFDDVVMTTYESFLVPPTLQLLVGNNIAKQKPRVLKQLPRFFDSSRLVVEQSEVASRDGTRIPYFVIHKRDWHKGQLPTLLYAYGGFEIPTLPGYGGVTGKVWLEQGGVYVVANIRGGGEFGPKWHQAALKENRQKAFDDFIAVSEDLIRRKITDAAHLGIRGGSNGGLLMGAVFTQRPELFKAVLCLVPLLDMFRYNKLLAGFSWEGEYGSPDDPIVRAAITKYSPYQNVRTGTAYPEVFFMTSTKDDRVHPGHARKMVARMEESGRSVYYYENTEGGHGAAANLDQKVKMTSLEFTYLWRKLGKKLGK